MPSREVVARAVPSAVAGAVAAGLLVMLAWSAGGYFASSYLLAGVVAFAVLAVILVLRPPHYPLSIPALVGLASLIGLMIWTGISSRWSLSPDTALEAMQRDLVYVGLFGLGLLAAGSGRFARHLMWTVLAVIVIVVGGGLLSRLAPSVLGGTASLASIGGYRLDYPLTYWNAYGALAAMGTVVALGLCADVRGRLWLRAAAAGSVVVLLTSMYLSFSRGAWLCLMVGLAARLALGPQRIWLVATAVPTLLAAALAIMRVNAYPELIDRSAGLGEQTAAGRGVLPFLILLVVGAAFAQAVMTRLRPESYVEDSLKRLLRPVAVPAGLVGGFLALVLLIAGPPGQSLDRFVNRQWQDFLQTGALGAVPVGRARLTTVRGTRSDLYRVALAEFAAHPIVGRGAGSFEPVWYRDRQVVESVRNAHSLYLETLAELGIIGGLLLLGFVGSLCAAMVQAKRRARGLRAAQTSAVASAMILWFVHAGVDWDWQMPALTGTALVLAATLYPEGRRIRRPETQATETAA